MLNETKIERRFPKHPDIHKDYIAKKDQLTELYRDFAKWVDDNIPDGRLKALALTNLETSHMFGVKAIDDEANAKAARIRKFNQMRKNEQETK